MERFVPASRLNWYRRMASTVELVLAARSGDLDAFTALIRLESTFAYRLALSILFSPADAEDATQEAWSRVWLALPRLRDAERWEPWFRQIVVRSAIDRNRAFHGMKEVPLDEATERTSGPFESDAERREILTRLMSQIRPEDRAILSLRYLFDLPVRQVAIEMGLSEGTVKSRIHRLLSRLQQESRSGDEH
jgi:RNA polymerase sigma-70 factor, ECF subfamily